MNQRRGASSAAACVFVMIRTVQVQPGTDARQSVGDQTSTQGEGTPVSLGFP